LGQKHQHGDSAVGDNRILPDGVRSKFRTGGAEIIRAHYRTPGQRTPELSEYRKMEPTPLEEWIFYDHPSGATRIRTAMRWKAENLVPLNPLP